MNTVKGTASAGFIGLLIGAACVWFLLHANDTPSGTEQGAASEPLYWVAPMDSDYRRDKPGKSPMGMDLVPVYPEAINEKAGGIVTISPEVVNNLGVRTAVVTRGYFDLTVNTVGYVQYDENRLIHIHPRVEGWIEKLFVKAAGEAVNEGEPLYALYSPTLVNAQEELLLALKRNNPVLIKAAKERLIALQVGEAEINRLQDTARVSQTITVRAPQSGVVDNLNVREGMFVKPGMEVMAIGQLTHIWVIGEVFERQAASVRVGDEVHMSLDYLPGREWRGTVDYIYPALNVKTRTAQVRVHFDNPDAYLRPGMFAQIIIASKPSIESLLIPREALIRTSSQARVVLAMSEGRFKSIEVKVGQIGERQVEILSGLEEGERIVASAQFLIDSESSKTSDFKRMSEYKSLSMAMAESDRSQGTLNSNSATVNGLVNWIDSDQRLINISRQAIEKWGRPPATLDFKIDESLDLGNLSAGDQIRFTFMVERGEFTVSQIVLLSEAGQTETGHRHD